MRHAALYNKFSNYLKKRYGEPVYKVSLDAGFNCPNRDGKISSEGCSYCDNHSFSQGTREGKPDLDAQIRAATMALKKRYSSPKFFLYFQAYSNTYAPLDRLKEVYDLVYSAPDIVGLSIATRPDCVDADIIELISAYSSDKETWIEYGLQSCHDKTLRSINRGHAFADFEKALRLTRKRRKINICAHVIIGLPGESEKMIMQTADVLGGLGIEGVKLHPLHIIKGTKLAQDYAAGRCKVLSLQEYSKIAVSFMERLPESVIIQRLGADCPEELLVAPGWIGRKNDLLAEIDKIMVARSTFQGKLYSNRKI